MPDSVILSAVRTPIGTLLGDLSSVAAPELGAIATRQALQVADVAPDQIDEVIMGCVLPAGLGQAPARQAALRAGLPFSCPATTINKVCGSGLKAVMLAAQSIALGDARVVVAGGMESMSRAPHLLPGVRQGWKLGDSESVDSMVLDGLTCTFENRVMGELAQQMADRLQISRADQDEFALESHRKAAAAADSG